MIKFLYVFGHVKNFFYAILHHFGCALALDFYLFVFNVT